MTRRPRPLVVYLSPSAYDLVVETTVRSTPSPDSRVLFGLTGGVSRSASCVLLYIPFLRMTSLRLLDSCKHACARARARVRVRAPVRAHASVGVLR
jgi:hypothetical protein